MQLIYFCVGCIIGGIVSSFTLIQVFIILFFGFPITKKLERMDLINKKNGIINGYFISLIMFSLIFSGIFYLLYSFFPSLLWGFVFGGIIALLFGFRQVGLTPNNIKDYLESNEKHLKASSNEIIGVMLQK